MQTKWRKLPAAQKLFPHETPKKPTNQGSPKYKKTTPGLDFQRDPRNREQQLKDYWGGA